MLENVQVDLYHSGGLSTPFQKDCGWGGDVASEEKPEHLPRTIPLVQVKQDLANYGLKPTIHKLHGNLPSDR